MASMYTTLALPLTDYLRHFIEGYLKQLPRYNGETRSNAEDHLFAFLDFADNLNIEHEDVFMRIFVQSLERNIRVWFRNLQSNFICSWVELTNIFIN